MPETLTELELVVVGWIGNDYEALHTIDKSVSEDAGREMSHSELHRILLSLQRRGLGDCYFFDRDSWNYKLTAGKTEENAEELSWLARTTGLRLFDSES